MIDSAEMRAKARAEGLWCLQLREENGGSRRR